MRGCPRARQFPRLLRLTRGRRRQKAFEPVKRDTFSTRKNLLLLEPKREIEAATDDSRETDESRVSILLLP